MAICCRDQVWLESKQKLKDYLQSTFIFHPKKYWHQGIHTSLNSAFVEYASICCICFWGLLKSFMGHTISLELSHAVCLLHRLNEFQKGNISCHEKGSGCLSIYPLIPKFHQTHVFWLPSIISSAQYAACIPIQSQTYDLSQSNCVRSCLDK